MSGGDIHCHQCYTEAIRIGFEYALETYGIWKNGERFIGCLETNIKEVLERFDQEDMAQFLSK